MKQVDEVANEAAVETPKKLSPKNKKTRGVDENTKTTYVPLDMSIEDNNIIHKAAKAKNVKVGELLGAYLQLAIKHNWENIVAEAESYIPSAGASKPSIKKIEDMNVDEAQEYIQKLEKQAQAAQDRARLAAEKAKALVAAARARAAGTAA